MHLSSGSRMHSSQQQHGAARRSGVHTASALHSDCHRQPHSSNVPLRAPRTPLRATRPTSSARPVRQLIRIQAVLANSAPTASAPSRQNGQVPSTSAREALVEFRDVHKSFGEKAVLKVRGPPCSCASHCCGLPGLLRIRLQASGDSCTTTYLHFCGAQLARWSLLLLDTVFPCHCA